MGAGRGWRQTVVGFSVILAATGCRTDFVRDDGEDGASEADESTDGATSSEDTEASTDDTGDADGGETDTGEAGDGTGDETGDETGGEDAFVDPRDRESYGLVTVGDQVWMTSNMRYAAPGSVCYGDDAGNCATFGRLYGFSAAQQACPEGWHLPSDDEWKQLESTLGMAESDLDLEGGSTPRGTDQGTQLKVGGSSGLEIQMSGWRNSDEGVDYSLGADTYLWSSTPSGNLILRRRLAAADAGVFRVANTAETFYISVRCLQD